jgi:hypothetical protein
VLALDGTIVAENPLNHLSNSCSPGLHQAVWIASLSVPGQSQPIRISVYVDSTAGAPDAALGPVRLQACLPSPEVPESQGGAPLGTKLLEAAFTLERLFTPQGTGLFQWVGRFVPVCSGHEHAECRRKRREPRSHPHSASSLPSWPPSQPCGAAGRGPRRRGERGRQTPAGPGRDCDHLPALRERDGLRVPGVERACAGDRAQHEAEALG